MSGALKVVSDGRPAPACSVAYRCGVCGGRGVLDAHLGPPSCLGGQSEPHAPTFMRPEALVREEGGK